MLANEVVTLREEIKKYTDNIDQLVQKHTDEVINQNKELLNLIDDLEAAVGEKDFILNALAHEILQPISSIKVDRQNVSSNPQNSLESISEINRKTNQISNLLLFQMKLARENSTIETAFKSIYALFLIPFIPLIKC